MGYRDDHRFRLDLISPFSGAAYPSSASVAEFQAVHGLKSHFEAADLTSLGSPQGGLHPEEIAIMAQVASDFS
jgi:hypothetical protein